MTKEHLRSACTCCEDFLSDLSRRRFLKGIAAAGAGVVLGPGVVDAAEGQYEAMVLACIDPRLQAPVRRYLLRRGLNGQYSQFVIAGAAIGVVADAFKEWQKAFWDNLATSVQLHRIKRVIAIDHRDCGAAKIAYGAAKIATRALETETHKAALAEFRRQVMQRQPSLRVETGLMALNGRIEIFA